MSKLSLKVIQNIILVAVFMIISAAGGYYFGVKGYELRLKKDVKKIEVLNKDASIPSSVDFSRFWEVWDSVEKKHIKRPLNAEKLLEGAISGMVDAIGDPYTSYLNIEENAQSKDSLNGKYEGIGAQLGFDDQNTLIIIAPLDGSPAKAMGILAGDKILAIDGKDSYGITLTEAVNKIRGQAGTDVVLTIQRGNEEPIDLKITRDTITVKSVNWEDKGNGIAYIRLSRFGETTNEEWSKSVSEIKTQMPNLKGIILDVRNNPGGFLDSAVYIGSDFISKGTIVKEDFSDGTSQTFTPNHKGQLTEADIKVIVLINRGSASASEIVAGALKERINAVLVGERSFGKGTVQSAEDFTDGASLHVTVAKWLTPDGNWIDSKNSEFKDSVYNERNEAGEEIIGGLKPDHDIPVTEEDVKDEKDPQLDKAIELLSNL
jgi:carboxyl-terminal processing protease